MADISESSKISVIKICLKSEEGKRALAESLKKRNEIILGDTTDPYKILQLFKMKLWIEEINRFELMEFDDDKPNS
jgi:hypothetical protein